MASPEIIKPMQQVAPGDCAIVCLHMMLQVPYEDVMAEARRYVRKPHQTGLYSRQQMAVARRFKHELRKVKAKDINFEEMNGILQIRRKGWHEHAVVLFNGSIYDPTDGMLYYPDAYFASTKYRPTHLLQV